MVDCVETRCIVPIFCFVAFKPEMPIALLIRRGIRRVCCIKEMCFDGSDDEDQQGEQVHKTETTTGRR